MSAKYLFAAMEMEFENSLQQLIFIRIANASDDEGYCFPKIKTLARQCKCGTTSVRNAIRFFENIGYLSTEFRKLESGINRSNVYRILIEVHAYAPKDGVTVIKPAGSTRDRSLEDDLTDLSWAD